MTACFGAWLPHLHPSSIETDLQRAAQSPQAQCCPEVFHQVPWVFHQGPNDNGIYWYRFTNTPKNLSIPIYLTLITSLKPPTSCHGRVPGTDYLFLLFTSWGIEIEVYVSSKEPRKIYRRKIHRDLLNTKAGPAAREVPEPKGFGGWESIPGKNLCVLTLFLYPPQGIECWSLLDSGLD